MSTAHRSIGLLWLVHGNGQWEDFTARRRSTPGMGPAILSKGKVSLLKTSGDFSSAVGLSWEVVWRVLKMFLHLFLFLSDWSNRHLDKQSLGSLNGDGA